MKNLKKISQFRSEYIYLAVLFLLIILSFEVLFFSLVLVMYLFYLWKKHPTIAKIGVILLVFFLVRVSLIDDQTIDTNNQHNVLVTSVKHYDNYASFRGKIKGSTYQFSYAGDNHFSVGEVYQMTLEKDLDKDGDVPYTFDLENYDKAQRIKGRYVVIDLTYQKKQFHMNQVIEFVDKRIKVHSPASYGYVKTMVLANNDALDDETKNAINTLGISHLFAVSGLHIGFLVLLLRKGLRYLVKRELYGDIFLGFFLIFYMFITSFTPSVVRASLMVMFLFVNHYGKLKLDSLDIVSIVFVILLFVHPYFYLQLGFQLSFLMTFFIILARPLLSSDDKLKSVFALSILAFFASLPFVVGVNQGVNLLTILLNGLYLFFVMFLLLPFAYATFVFPLFDELYKLLIDFFEESIILLAEIDFFMIDFVINQLIYVVIYYILFIWLLIQLEERRVKQGLLIAIGVFFTFLLFQGKFVIYDSVHFVNIYGDATVIQSAHDRCNILVDTGVEDPYDELIIYMKNHHIKRLDYVIISHHHADHHGELKDILGSFDVKEIIDSSNVENYQELNHCGNVQFFFYPMDKDHHNENDNSLLMSLYIQNDHYLFTGDIEYKVEESFVSKYELDQVDKLKVPHHGSITSSSDIFINHVSPVEAFVIVALENTHNHPSEHVIERYVTRGIDVYRTDQLGTIEVRYLFRREWKKTSKK